MRTEKDSMGSTRIPDDAYWGVQTARAKENFPISGEGPQPGFVTAMVQIKKACALTNRSLGKLDGRIADAIVAAADEVLGGALREQWVVDPYQAGAGTSHNMNTNEVLANRANEMLGGVRGSYDPVGPNDHVNMSQSTNDTIPTAIRLIGISGARNLAARLTELADALGERAAEFDGIVKAGRTHLQDAVPVRLGQEFGAYAANCRRHVAALTAAEPDMCAIGLGGSATGTGLNTHPEYRATVAKALEDVTGYPLVPADDYFEAMQSMAPVVVLSGAVRSLALDLTRIANDLRLLSSGPRTGLAEIDLPAVQPGSSIMPGKVNPVMAECLNMVCFGVLGHDTTIAYASQAGQLELNVMMPVIANALEKELTILANAVGVFTTRCVAAITANAEQASGYAESTLALCTILNERIGYMKAAEVAKLALANGVSIREATLELGYAGADELDRLFDTGTMTEPG